MAIEEVKMFRTSDYKTFEDKEIAELHQQAINQFADWYVDNPLASTQEFDVLNWLLTNSNWLYQFVSSEF